MTPVLVVRATVTVGAASNATVIVPAMSPAAPGVQVIAYASLPPL